MFKLIGVDLNIVHPDIQSSIEGNELDNDLDFEVKEPAAKKSKCDEKVPLEIMEKAV